MKTFRSNGKLLLTAEYVVLDGAKALAVPTQFGQSMTVKESNFQFIEWESFDEFGNIWFKDTFSITENHKHIRTGNAITNRLIQILKAAKDLNNDFLNEGQGFNIKTHLEFNKNWGLGSSSTLINNIANWANVNAYELLNLTFGGSGYDIACAQHNVPIIYQRNNIKQPKVNEVCFNPSFKDNLYFVYLNQKQNSRDGISSYKSLNKIDDRVILEITKITEDLLQCNSLSGFIKLLDKHELIISGLIDKKPIKSELFQDFEGGIKSLGAWGGDFILVATTSNPVSYFSNKGFNTVLSYSDMVLN